MSYQIAFLGPVATFTDLAVSRLFPGEMKIPMSTIPECLDAVNDGTVDIAVVPIENALEGSVNITLDYLVHEACLPIQGEIIAPIQQHFMMHPDNADATPEMIYSHSHALAQCHKCLHKEFKGVPIENTTSTAAAAKWIKDHPEKNYGAIANELAAKVYGLEIVKRDIHDYSHNHTKFVVVAKHELAFKGTGIDYQSDKTTVMITLPSDQAGTLHQVLSAFSWRRLNLSKIESRPMKTGLGNYLFIIDIEMKMDDVLIPGVTSELEALGCKVSLLGSYPSYVVQQNNIQCSLTSK